MVSGKKRVWRIMNRWTRGMCLCCVLLLVQQEGGWMWCIGRKKQMKIKAKILNKKDNLSCNRLRFLQYSLVIQKKNFFLTSKMMFVNKDALSCSNASRELFIGWFLIPGISCKVKVEWKYRTRKYRTAKFDWQLPNTEVNKHGIPRILANLEVKWEEEWEGMGEGMQGSGF